MVTINNNNPVQDEQFVDNNSNENVEQIHDQETANEQEINLDDQAEALETESSEEDNYLTLSEEELVAKMKEVSSSSDLENNKKVVDELKSVFYKKYRAGLDKAREEFLAEEGAEEKDFLYSNLQLEQDFKESLHSFKEKISEIEAQKNLERENNLKIRLDIIEKIKELINSEETLNDTFTEFNQLREQWNAVGQIPQSETKAIWESYHHIVQQFYDYIKINKELRDLDLKKNLEIKTQLCEKTEDLLLLPNIIEAFKKLQQFHDTWREVGPVPHEQKNVIWDRFSAATSQINKKHQDYFLSIKEEQKNNLDAKTALCEQIDAILASDINSHQKWIKGSETILEIQKIWKTIGFAPKKANNEIYNRFRISCDKFFELKKEFYQKSKEEQEINLNKKIALCEKAEALKDSDDWKKTADELIRLQKEWKKVGAVSRKESESIWNRFRAACDIFFNRKNEYFKDIDSVYEENLANKTAIIKEITEFVPGENIDENLAALKVFQRRWSEIGFVPFKQKEEIQQQYRDSINKHFDAMNIASGERKMMKFKSRVEDMSKNPGASGKIRQEREKCVMRLKKLESDITVLENNIGFFASSKNADSLIKDVKKKIENAKKDIADLKNQIRMIDEIA